MSANQHNAPWSIRRDVLGYVNEIIGDNGQAICYGTIEEEPAKLIAAAPELVDALSALLDASEGHAMSLQVKQQARNALAKAGAL